MAVARECGPAVRRWHEREGRELSYQVIGEGPRVLLLSGFGCSGSAWLPWLRRVGPLGLRVLLPDNRGTGASSRGGRPYDMASLADDAAAILRRDGGARASVVVGHSMGGMIAQHLALRHPELVRGLILSASAAEPPAFERARLRTLPSSILGLISRSAAVWRLADGLLVDASRSRLEAHEIMRPLRELQASETYTRLDAWLQLSAIARHRTTERLGQLRMPVSLVAGAGDRVIPPSSSELLASQIAQAKLTILEGVGHEIPHEAPRALSRVLLEHMALLERAGAERAGTE